MRFVWIAFFAMRCTAMNRASMTRGDVQRTRIYLHAASLAHTSAATIDAAMIDGTTRTALRRREPDRMESVCTPSRRTRPALRRTGAEASLRAGAQSKPRRSSSDRVTAAGGGWRARVCAMDRAGVQLAPGDAVLLDNYQ
jgi:hypothetical protein